MGDQFVWRDGVVHQLFAETGELASLGESVGSFFARIRADPGAALSTEPLLRFEAEGGRLKPGQLLSVWPPFCTAESAQGVSLKAVDAADRLAFLVAFARELRGVPDGAGVTVVER